MNISKNGSKLIKLAPEIKLNSFVSQIFLSLLDLPYINQHYGITSTSTSDNTVVVKHEITCLGCIYTLLLCVKKYAVFATVYYIYRVSMLFTT